MGETIFKKLFPFFVLQICRKFASGIKNMRIGRDFHNIYN